MIGSMDEEAEEPEEEEEADPEEEQAEPTQSLARQWLTSMLIALLVGAGLFGPGCKVGQASLNRLRANSQICLAVGIATDPRDPLLIRAEDKYGSSASPSLQ